MSDTFNPSDIDPLDQLLARQQKATAKPEADNTTVPQNADDDEYGINDADREIAEEDAAREAAEAERIAALRAQQEAATEVAMPPQSLDPDYQREAVGHQVTVFEEVSRLVGVIIEKHQLEGCLDYSDDHELGPDDPMNPKRRQIIGDLIELYQINPTDAEYSPSSNSMSSTTGVTASLSRRNPHRKRCKMLMNRQRRSKSLVPSHRTCR